MNGNNESDNEVVRQAIDFKAVPLLLDSGVNSVDQN